MIFLVLAVGLAEAIITGYYKEIYMLSLPLGYGIVLFCNFFLFKFASYVMNKGEKAVIPLVIIAIIIIIMLFLPWNWWGVPTNEIGEPDIRIYSTMSVVAFSWSIYFYIAIICHKLKKDAPDRVSLYGSGNDKYINI